MIIWYHTRFIYLFIYPIYAFLFAFVFRYCLLFSISWKKTKYLSIDSPIRILSSIIRGLSADNVYGLFARTYPRTFVSHNLWTRFKNNPKIWYRVSTQKKKKIILSPLPLSEKKKKKEVIARTQDINPVLIASQIKIPLGKSLFTWRR